MLSPFPFIITQSTLLSINTTMKPTRKAITKKEVMEEVTSEATSVKREVMEAGKPAERFLLLRYL